jgi:hypothetical protein
VRNASETALKVLINSLLCWFYYNRRNWRIAKLDKSLVFLIRQQSYKYCFSKTNGNLPLMLQSRYWWPIHTILDLKLHFRQLYLKQQDVNSINLKILRFLIVHLYLQKSLFFWKCSKCNSIYHPIVIAYYSLFGIFKYLNSL